MKKSLKGRRKGSLPPASRLKSTWQEVRPIVLFVGLFVLIMLVFYLAWLSDFATEKVQPVIASVNASISSFILNILGQHTGAIGDRVASSCFSTSVRRGCDAVEAMALFSATVLSFPAPWKKKLTGLVGGVLILFLLNIFRVVSLFLTGVYYPRAFELMHVEIWQVLFIFVAIGLFLMWLGWSNKTMRNARS